MIETKHTRGITLSNGTKTSLHLEVATWAAIDYIAAQEGRKWQRWANDAIDASSDTSNLSSTIRAAALDNLLNRQRVIDAEGATQALDENHEIVGSEYYRLDDEALQSELDAARITHRDSAFAGFEVIAGYRGIPGDPQDPFLCIRSAMRGDLHAFIVKREWAHE
jgi:predicted DNA-binding ribbon-helix-helix protein